MFKKMCIIIFAALLLILLVHSSQRSVMATPTAVLPTTTTICGGDSAVVHVVDKSGSMAISLPEGITRWDALLNAFNSVVPQLDGEQALVVFDGSPEVVQVGPSGDPYWTTDAQNLINGAAAYSPSGNTEIYTAIVEAAELLRGREGGNKPLVLYTDSLIDSQTDIDAIITLIEGLRQEEELEGFRVFAVGIDIPFESELALNQITAAGGGSWGKGTNPDEIDAVVEEIVTKACLQTITTYIPIVMRDFCSATPRNYALLVGRSGSAGTYKFGLENEPSVSGLEATKIGGEFILNISPEGRDKILVVGIGGQADPIISMYQGGNPAEAIQGLNLISVPSNANWTGSDIVTGLQYAIAQGVRDVIFMDDMNHTTSPASEFEMAIQVAKQEGVRIHVFLTETVGNDIYAGYGPNYGLGQYAAAQTGGTYAEVSSLSEAQESARKIGSNLFCWMEVPGGTPSRASTVAPSSFTVGNPQLVNPLP